MNAIAEALGSDSLGIGGPGTGAERAPQAPARPAPALPCLQSEQLNWRGGRSQKKRRRRLEIEINGLALVYSFERLAFFTATFPDNVRSIKEAQRRFNSMNTNAMRGRFQLDEYKRDARSVSCMGKRRPKTQGRPDTPAPGGRLQEGRENRLRFRRSERTGLFVSIGLSQI